MAAALAFCAGALAFSNEVSFKQLPAEARQTLAHIKAGGPFPYAKDGSVFGNREGLLPKRSRGYYNPVVSDGKRLYMTGYASVTALDPVKKGRSARR